MQLNAALAHQRQWGGRLGNILIDKEMVDELVMYEALAAHAGMRLVSLAKLNPAPSIVRMLPLELCEQKRVIACALQEQKRVIGVATSDPLDLSIQDDVAFRTGMNARVVVAPEREIEWAIRHYFKGDPSPCPPPKQRRMVPAAEEFKIVDVAGQTVMKSVDELRAEHEAQQRSSAAPEASGPFAAAPPPASGTAPLEREVAKLRAGLAEQTIVIRSLVDLCIRRGVFTPDELQTLVQEARTRR